MQSTPSLPSLPGPLWPRVVAPDKGLIYGSNRTKRWFQEFTELLKIELFRHLNCILILNWIIWNKNVFTFNSVYCSVSWSGRIHWLHLCRGVRHPTNECPRYDTKQSDDQVPVMQEVWAMWITSSLPSLPGPLWPRVVAPDKVLSMD